MLGGELVALDLDLEQVPREVVARVVDVVLHLGEDVVVEALERLRPLLRLIVDALERRVHELAEQLFVLCREPEHPTDHVHRDVLGVLHGSIDHRLAGNDLAHLVEQLVAQHADLVLPRLDLLRSERRQQQAAGHAVERRIAGDRRRATDRRRQREIAGSCRADDDGCGCVKFSVSYATSWTVSWVSGTHMPP